MSILSRSVSPSISSSSSVGTSGSITSLAGIQSASSSVSDGLRAESWEETGYQAGLPSGSEDEQERAWRDGVTLRKGWQFLDAAAAQSDDMGLGNRTRKRFSHTEGPSGTPGRQSPGGFTISSSSGEMNRVSIAETVKPSLSNVSSHEQLSFTLEGQQQQSFVPSPSSDSSHFMSPITPLGRKSRASSISALGVSHSLTKSSSSSSSPSSSSSSPPPPPPSSTKPTWVELASPSNSPASASPLFSSSFGFPHSSARHSPPLQNIQSFSRAQAYTPPSGTPPPGSSSTPSLPAKPIWLQSNPLSSSLSQTSVLEPSNASSSCSSTPKKPSSSSSSSSTRNGKPYTSSNHTPYSQAVTSSLSLSSAPPLPPRSPQIQKHVAEAEFSSSSSKPSGGRFGLGSGIKGRLAAIGGAVGGVATGFYNERSTYTPSFSNQSNSSYPQSFNSLSSSSSISTLSTSSTSSPYLSQPSTFQPDSFLPAVPKQRTFPQVLFSVPGSAVRHFNSSWRARAGSPSSSSSLASQASSTTSGTVFQWRQGFPRPIVYDPEAIIPTGSGARVFGRNIDLVGRECGVAPEDKDTVGRLIGRRSREILPALVVRCTEYLEIWAPREEGIFRISGRSTHIQKLRAQFDIGADIDLKLSDPGELDPHAVAGVFKAYLRELPDPILTSELTPGFDHTMRQYTGSTARDGAFGASATSPNLTGSELTSDRSKASLVTEIQTKLGRLPETSWYLLQAVVGLLDHTARYEEVNKMTLSNLLLVFCPSLCFSPPFLRLLVENYSVLFVTPPLPSTVSSKPTLPPRPLGPSQHTRSSSSCLDQTAPLLELSSPCPELFSGLSRRPSRDALKEANDMWIGDLGKPLPPQPVGRLDLPTDRNVDRNATGLSTGLGRPVLKVKTTEEEQKGEERQNEENKNRGIQHGSAKLAEPSRQKPVSCSKRLPVARSVSGEREGYPTERNVADHVTVPGIAAAATTSSSTTSTAEKTVLTGVVASRRYLFSTPIADRFKSTTVPHLAPLRPVHNRTMTMSDLPVPTPDGGVISSASVSASALSSSLSGPLVRSADSSSSLNRQLRRGANGGIGGGFFSSRGASGSSASASLLAGSRFGESRVDPDNGGQPAAARKKTPMWKRSSVAVGFGSGGAGGTGNGNGDGDGLGSDEQESRRSVKETIKALEAHSDERA
ncbi:Rac GTPase-activating protein BCR/ABR [Phaffia rhodozyma]|uniref:Rac GTPase-activating protein BCR/ABR n=1 Tax=Phaffia rhodozyma TaxID=264483 RepID=A0A0F7SS49_PHARH|nr:Rac GTPase-activating protein BCR/ABR [Phaffia rhodozyma]